MKPLLIGLMLAAMPVLALSTCARAADGIYTVMATARHRVAVGRRITTMV